MVAKVEDSTEMMEVADFQFEKLVDLECNFESL